MPEEDSHLSVVAPLQAHRVRGSLTLAAAGTAADYIRDAAVRTFRTMTWMYKRRREVQPAAVPADAPTVMLRRGAPADAPGRNAAGAAHLQPRAAATSRARRTCSRA